MRRPLSLLLPLVLAALAACNRAPTGPVDTYRAFHARVKKGQAREAYALLSEPTQQALDARARAMGQALGSQEPPDPAALLFANARPPGDVTEITLVREEGSAATVRVVSSGAPSDVRMVREPSGWKLDLTDSLRPESAAPASGPPQDARPGDAKTP